MKDLEKVVCSDAATRWEHFCSRQPWVSDQTAQSWLVILSACALTSRLPGGRHTCRPPRGCSIVLSEILLASFRTLFLFYPSAFHNYFRKFLQHGISMNPFNGFSALV